MEMIHQEEAETEIKRTYKCSFEKDKNDTGYGNHKGYTLEIHRSSTLKEIAVRYSVPTLAWRT